MHFFIFIITFLFSIHLYAGPMFLSEDSHGYSCQEYLEVLKPRLKADLKKPLVFYIHGRGKHPQKGIAYLPRFEKRYNINVLMFHWDSWINAITRPEDSAVQSAPQALLCISKLIEFKEKNGYLFHNRNVYLMSHSMGGIVLKTLLEKYEYGLFPKNSFDAVILNAPDVPASNHDWWIDKAFDFTSKVFVTLNGDDLILFGSRLIDIKDFKLFKGNRLGASTSNFLLFGNSLSRDVTYLDFSYLTFGGHRYFIPKKKSSDRREPIEEIYEELFKNGDKFKVPFHYDYFHSNILIFSDFLNENF
jgi:hypothetical protein